MKQKVLFIAVSLVFALSAPQQNKAQDSIGLNLTFEELVSVAFKQSHVIKQTAFLKEQKQMEFKVSRSIQFPRLELNANMIQMSDNLHLDLNPVKDAISPLYQSLSAYGSFSGVPSPAGGVLPDNISTQVMRSKLAEGLETINAANWDEMIQKKQFATVNLMATWPIFTGGKIMASKQAARLEIEDVNLISSEKNNQLTSELVERYFGLCLAKQAELVREEVLKVMQEHTQDAEKLKNQGQVANVELLHARVFYSDAERELKKAGRNSTIANKALLNSIGQVEDTQINPLTSLFYLEEIEPIEYFMNEAAKNNPQLKQIESKKSLAEIGVKVETANYLPTVALMGTYDVVNLDLSPYVPKWLVGVGLKWTIFDGAERMHKRKSAQMKVEQVNEFQQKASNDLQTGIEKYYQEIQMSLEQIHELNTANEFTEEYYQARQKAFREGMATSTDVVDAKLLLVKVQIEKLQAAYQFDISLAKLLELCGMSENFITYQKSPKSKIETFNQ
jgi:outer membrane protein TolC